jgi:type IVB pilus formation R64 PilN family outer membrane protein
MKKITKLSTISLATIFLLDGCASTITANKRLKEDTEKATTAFNAAYDHVPTSPLFVKDNGMWVNPKPLPVMADPQPDLPNIFKKDVSLTFPGRVSLNEIVSELSRSTGVVFSVSQDVYKPDDSTLATVVSANADAGSSSSSGSAQQAAPGALSPLANAKNDALITVDSFVYRGDLKQALDVLTQKSNLSWKWTSNGIQLFRYESKNFYIAAFDGTTNRQTAVSTAAQTSASQGGSSGGGTQGNSSDTGSQIKYSSQTSSMDEITAYLRSMMSSGGRISTLGSAGIITVRDTPQVLETVDKAIKELNATLTKQVSINVQIYQVALSDADNYQVNWNVVWNSNKYKSSFVPLSSSSSSSTTTNVSNTLTGGQTFSAGILTGPFAGTSLAVEALSNIGNIVSSIQNTAVTLNGQSAPLISQEEIGYVKSTTVTTSGSGSDANTSVQINPDTITQGLNMIATPKIQPNGKVLLEYNINLANVKQIQTYSASGTSVQLPTRDVQSIIQRASLRSGQTLVLSGFQNVGSNVSNQGILSANNPLLGGGKSAQNSKTQLVILITPYVTDN